MGPRLRAVRKLHGLTQQELAAQAGVSKSLVSKVETGEKPGSWDLAISVARALRVDAGALMGDASLNVNEPSGRIAAALPAIRRMLATFDCPPDLGAPARTLRTLADEVDAACRMRLDAKYVPLAESIPGLAAELSAVLCRRETPCRRALLSKGRWRPLCVARIVSPARWRPSASPPEPAPCGFTRTSMRSAHRSS
jgi:transcriptional regulator with XRE-family HTH domain